VSLQFLANITKQFRNHFEFHFPIPFPEHTVIVPADLSRELPRLSPPSSTRPASPVLGVNSLSIARESFRPRGDREIGVESRISLITFHNQPQPY
jgi:hypothetical protein